MDEYGRAYQVFTVKEAQELLNSGPHKIIRLFKELENIYLIERKYRGQGKASHIYLLKL
ncbi:hypothetical protein [Anaerostipes sp.]|uniref:hypothetical protein n=1 Tax=Anaerostipes sp. TaxID=1872530 RepID=UPI003FA42115